MSASKTIKYGLWVVLLALFACEKSGITIGKPQESSIGVRNHITLVIEDKLWNSEVGDSIRKYIARPVSGSLSFEPIFDITQLDEKLYTNDEKKNRNILLFQIGEDNQFTLEKSVYASPQNLFKIQYNSPANLIKSVKNYSDSIVTIFHETEVNEEQHSIARSQQHDNTFLKELFGIDMKIPIEYQIKQQTDEPFLWFQKQLPSGDVNLVIYEFPIDFFFFPNEIVQLFEAQNIIGEKFIRNRANTGYYRVDDAFIPEVMTVSFAQMTVFEIKGGYKMMNDIFFGPYILYVFKDTYYNRYLFVQGFINHLNKPKREELMELEAIIKSINFFEDK